VPIFAAGGPGIDESMGGVAGSDPSLAERRELKKTRLKEDIVRELEGITCRKASWSRSECEAMDAKCLKEGKRCVMWSDTGSGWYVLINWDWKTNRPRAKGDTAADTRENEMHIPGYYEDLRKILKKPLLDGSVPPDRLAAWIDQNTISIHHHLLETLSFTKSQ
jgi:hypothetical protein